MMPLPDKPPILSVRHLSTGYGKKQVLFDINLDVAPGEIVLITGGNGSGKSTLLKAIYGLIPPWNADAEILFQPDPSGSVVSTCTPTNNRALGIAYLPQKDAVFDDLTAWDNLRLAGQILRGGKEFESRSDEVLTALPSLIPLLGRKPGTMSGGERQMVALGMVLLNRPKLLLLDEPFGGLDSKAVDYVSRTIGSYQQHQGVSFLLVEHRQLALPELPHRRVQLSLGSIAIQQFAIL